MTSFAIKKVSIESVFFFKGIFSKILSTKMILTFQKSVGQKPVDEYWENV